MNRENAIKTLMDHAKGIVNHSFTGNCPDRVDGPQSRDPRCKVCQAIKEIEEGTRCRES